MQDKREGFRKSPRETFGVSAHDKSVFTLAQHARRSLTPLEVRFHRESRSRFPVVSWRRYHPVTIRAFPDISPSTWYVPFLNLQHKLIVVIEDRPDFPYRIYGQNWKLYAKQGYTVL